ncbi:NAD binding oxidoreductase [Polychytrium aggregatum]|uniref:NAD binding oxidoreductase n=1 Tax=Polychytrium aggregatum TaxID=110093 RepID=UPI0022FED0B1|nr:NAD binding oxidoreductase [Polychytrium aggregatum]KAI9205439.1 NAD binding oxidoreductase [Polychytrium aggregatum]
MLAFRAVKALSRASPAPAKDENAVRIGILGAANIAPMACVLPLSHLPNGTAYAVAARKKERASEFAKKHSIPVVHDSYEALLQDPNVDAVFIPLPNALHARWAVEAIRHGKHVLCEKPFTDNASQAQEVIDALAAHNQARPADSPPVLCMEAFHWKTHPAAQFFKSVLQNQVGGWSIGSVQAVHTAFKIPSIAFGDTDIRYNFGLGGGATMDAGCYAVSAWRFAVDACSSTKGYVPQVENATATRWTKDDKIDVNMTATLVGAAGIQGSITAMFQAGLLSFEATITVVGDAGTLTYTNFIAPSIYHAIELKPKNGSGKLRKEYTPQDGYKPTYFYQMRAFLDAVQRKNADYEAVGLTETGDALINMTVIDAIYTKAGLPLRP